GGGSSPQRQHSSAAGPLVARHGPAGVAGRPVRLRDDLPADGRAPHGARLRARPRHPRGGHARDHRLRLAPASCGAPRPTLVSDEQREALHRLERRVEVLEQMMRRLLAPGAAPEPIATLPEPRPATPPPVAGPPIVSRSTGEAPDLEQWFGQRGLLVVGVLALLAAMGFFLKYAIDRGWIAPIVRSLLAIGAGVAVGVWGEARIRGGLRRYGAAMIGAGGGLAYLGLWAAAGPYGLIERRLGVLLLAACTVVGSLLALRHEVEGHAIW